MKISLKEIGFVLIVSIYIFVPPLFPFGMSIVMGMGFIMYCICNYHRIRNTLLSKPILITYFIFLVSIIWVTLSYIYVYGSITNLLPILVNYIYLLIYSITGAIVICDLLIKYKFKQNKIWKYIIYAGAVQGVLAILAFMNVHIQNLCCIFLENIMSKDIIDYWRNYRLYGLACSLTYSMPIVQSLLGGLAILYARKYNEKFYFLVPILWGSAIINARVSLIVIIIEMLTLVLIGTRKSNEYKLIKKSSFCIILLLFICILVTILTAARHGISFERITDPILEIVSLFKGDIVFKSEGYLAYFFVDPKALVMPVGKELLFGGGIWNNTSDIGYIRNLWVGGIFYCIFIYVTYLIYLRKMYKKLKRTTYDFCPMVIIIGITLFVVNIKGDIFGGMNEVQNLFFLLVGISLFINRKGVDETFE